MKNTSTAIFKVVFVFVFVFALGTVGTVRADDPTPTPYPTLTITPTFRAAEPLPTSGSLYLHPTPTLLPYTMLATPSIPFQFAGAANTLADTTINAWRWANHDHVLDLLVFVTMAGVIVAFALQMMGNMQKNKD